MTELFHVLWASTEALKRTGAHVMGGDGGVFSFLLSWLFQFLFPLSTDHPCLHHYLTPNRGSGTEHRETGDRRWMERASPEWTPLPRALGTLPPRTRGVPASSPTPPRQGLPCLSFQCLKSPETFGIQASRSKRKPSQSISLDQHFSLVVSFINQRPACGFFKQFLPSGKESAVTSRGLYRRVPERFNTGL